MEQPINTTSIVDMFMHPVFRVKDTVIVEANQLAQQHQIKPGSNVMDLLVTGQQEYAAFRGGFLSLAVSVGGVNYIAGVVRHEDSDLFHLRSNTMTPELRTLALAAQNINQPLANVMNVADQFLSQKAILENPEMRAQAALMNRSLYQLMRIIKNMESAGGCNLTKSFDTVNIVSLMSEFLNKAAAMTTADGKHLDIKLPHETIYCLADAVLIERAVYNMLSNALKFSPANSTVTVEMTHNSNMLRFSVGNRSDRKNRDLMATAYLRYLREPGFDDGRSGLGLGLSIIQTAAAAHGGALLLDYPEEDIMRFTMTIAIANNKPGMLSSKIMLFDYAGGYDHALLELSDILSASEYADLN